MTRRLSTTQAAARLGIHRKTLIKYHRLGWINAIRTPAIDPRGSRLRFAEIDVARLERRLESRGTRNATEVAQESRDQV